MNIKHLDLTLLRLKPPEAWVHPGGGLTFVLTRSGAAKYAFGTFNGELVEGDVLVLNGESAKLSARDGNELALGCISLRAEHLFASFRVSEICRLQRVIAEFKDPRLYPASTPVAVECHRLFGEVSASASARLDQDRHSQLLWSAAALLSPELNNSRNQGAVRGFHRLENSMIHKFEKLTPEDLLNLSADELADKFQCGRQQLNRLFHQHFGLSIMGLKVEMRLLKAISLLREHDSKTKDVAEKSGFDHFGLFSTCFKRRFGVSPAAWRRLN